MTDNSYIQLAMDAAREAGSFLLDEQLKLDENAIERKTEHDFVSYVDRAAERLIVTAIQSRFPDHAILAEESGPQGQADYCWVIDPLDGTSNYIHGLPHFAVSIALYFKGKACAGVVYHPASGELFHAASGQGSFLDGRAIHVSQQHILKNVLAVSAFPFRDRSGLETALAVFRAVFGQIHDIRRSGSAALDLAYVACGRYDCYFESLLAPWDYAAGRLLVTEAGGVVADYANRPLTLEHSSVLAANREIFSAVQQIIAVYIQANKTVICE